MVVLLNTLGSIYENTWKFVESFIEFYLQQKCCWTIFWVPSPPWHSSSQSLDHSYLISVAWPPKIVKLKEMKRPLKSNKACLVRWPNFEQYKWRPHSKGFHNRRFLSLNFLQRSLLFFYDSLLIRFVGFKAVYPMAFFISSKFKIQEFGELGLINLNL